MYDKSKYYVDFSNHENLTNVEKSALENIQSLYRPIERINLLMDYKIAGKITDDEYQTMTGIPYNFGQ